MKKILFTALAAIGLSLLVSSCVKEKGFEERVSEIVAAQLDSLNKQVASLEKTQAALNDSLKSIKGDIEKLSQQGKALTDSISKVKADLAEQKQWTEGELKVVGDRISLIGKKQKAFETEIDYWLGRLERRIQKIDVIPDYNDGSVNMSRRDTVVHFLVSPDSIAREIAKEHPKGDSTFTFFAVSTVSTKADADMDSVRLDIKGVSYKGGGIIAVKVNGKNLSEEFYVEEQTYNACLVIGDGNSDNSSGFFPLTPVVERANCHIASEAGIHKFKATKGNSKQIIQGIQSVEVLWESFGTNETPTQGAIISSVSYAGNGTITYTVTEKKGNAVIAAKGGSDILWTWHIWCTDQPEEQVYVNNSGTMMDRNLGATNAKPGDPGALGLQYQWGRKDPFLGSSSVSTNTKAKSTNNWLEPIETKDCQKENENTLSYTVSNPTQFIISSANESSHDWYSTDSTKKNDFLWKDSDGRKTIYDPCPAGWRVPEGGENGFWAKAGFPSTYTFASTYGMDFQGYVTPSAVCWYPACGRYDIQAGKLADVGKYGCYWSCTPAPTAEGVRAFSFFFNNEGLVKAVNDDARVGGRAVRCVLE